MNWEYVLLCRCSTMQWWPRERLWGVWPLKSYLRCVAGCETGRTNPFGDVLVRLLLVQTTFVMWAVNLAQCFCFSVVSMTRRHCAENIDAWKYCIGILSIKSKQQLSKKNQYYHSFQPELESAILGPTNVPTAVTQSIPQLVNVFTFPEETAAASIVTAQSLPLLPFWDQLSQ